jgi:hypothetical protein
MTKQNTGILRFAQDDDHLCAMRLFFRAAAV